MAFTSPLKVTMQEIIRQCKNFAGRIRNLPVYPEFTRVFPPVSTPMNYANESDLGSTDFRLYDYIVRHFVASVRNEKFASFFFDIL
jgi:hypothetical protein